jgi:hypothetical protein
VSTVPPSILITPVGSLDRARRRLRDSGWVVHDGFDLTPDTWAVDGDRFVCVGTVAREEDEVAALFAALRGASLLVDLVDESARTRFVSDLGRVGPVTRLGGEDGPDALQPQDAELLDALSRGESIEATARRLGMSRRTAHRRLARARAALGAPTTAAAVARFARSAEPEC